MYQIKYQNPNTIMASRIISTDIMEQLDKMGVFLRAAVEACDPKAMETEPNFQKQFFDIVQENINNTPLVISNEIKTEVLTHPSTKCISKSDVTFWKVDFLLQLDNALIPIELKLRHKGQDITNYDQDYIDDVDRIRKFLVNYDDCPKGYAIMLTDNEDLKNKCEEKASAYSKENKLTDKREVKIYWTKTEDDYYIGIVGRVQTESRIETPKDKKFVFLSEEQKEELNSEDLFLDTDDSEDISFDEGDSLVEE